MKKKNVLVNDGQNGFFDGQNGFFGETKAEEDIEFETLLNALRLLSTGATAPNKKRRPENGKK